MRFLPILGAVVLLVTLGCRAKPKDGGGGAAADVADTSSQTVADEGGGEAEPPPATATADAVKISGAVQVPDDDLTPISPASSTLWLSSEHPYSVTCSTLASNSVTCSAPMIANDSHNGTFEMQCAGAGADTLTCYLVKGKRRDTILFDGLPILTVGNGNLVMNISTAGDGVPLATLDIAKSTALTNVAADLAAAKAANTTLPSLTGTWDNECKDKAAPNEADIGAEDANDGAVCYTAGPIYFVDATSKAGKRTISAWNTKADYETCFDPATNQPKFGIRADNFDLSIDFRSTASFLQDMNEFVASLPPAVLNAERYWLERLGGWTNADSYCLAHSAHPLCQIIGSGPYAGLTGAQRDVIIADVAYSLQNRSVSQFPSVCETTPADFSHCVGAMEKTNFCENVSLTTHILVLDLVGDDLVAANLDRDFAECNDGAPGRKYLALCDAAFGVAYELNLAFDGTGRMIAHTSTPEAEQSPYEGTMPLDVCLVGQEYLETEACRAMFLAKSKAEQQALLKQALKPLPSSSYCPDSAVSAPEDGAACRAEFLAETKATQRDEVAWFSRYEAFAVALCEDQSLGNKIKTGPRCMPDAWFGNDCFGEDCPIEMSLKCYGQANERCFDEAGEFRGAIQDQYFQIFDVGLGVNGAMSLAEISSYEYTDYGFEDSTEPRACKSIVQSIQNGTLLGVNEFVFNNQYIYDNTCDEESPKDFGVGAMKATRQTTE